MKSIDISFYCDGPYKMQEILLCRWLKYEETKLRSEEDSLARAVLYTCEERSLVPALLG